LGAKPEGPGFFAPQRPSSLFPGLAWNLHFDHRPEPPPNYEVTGSIRAPRAPDPSDIDAKAMKMITAIIRPWKLDDLQMAVARLGVQGITVTEVTGYGRQRGHAEHYRGSEYQVEFVPKLRVEIVLDDASAEAVIEAITNVCRTGKTGDGKIFLAPVGEAVRIRTRESDAAAA
jgi:nitrogen regulatory protein PII